MSDIYMLFELISVCTSFRSWKVIKAFKIDFITILRSFKSDWNELNEDVIDQYLFI